MVPEPFHLAVDGGWRFCLYHPPRGDRARAAVVYIHPFAEEMNKSRRMAALQARALASAGCAIVQIDLAGCGDSSGDFGDADWQGWVADVGRAVAWLRRRTDAPLWLWGLRAGCLVAVEAAASLGEGANFLFWQPVLSGRQHLQQFLRLKMAGELVGGDPRGVMDSLRQQLARGEPVEVAGYCLAPALAAGLEAAALTPATGKGRVAWLEVAAHTGGGLGPASQKGVEAWRGGGFEVETAVVTAPAFWQTVEITEVPELLAVTLRTMLGDGQ